MSAHKQSSLITSAVCETIPWQHPSLPILLNWNAGKHLNTTRFHYHTIVLEIHIIRRGNGRYLIDRQLVPFQGYTALVIQPGQRHRCLHKLGQWLQKVTLMADQSLLSVRPAGSIAGTLPEWIKLSSEELNILEMRCRIMEHEIHHPSSISLTVIQNELENMILLLQQAGERKAVTPVSDSRMLKVIDFIETNYAQKLNIEQLAATVAMSPGHLSHLFKQQTLMSIKHFILQCRIAAAKVCLESARDVKMVVLAEQLGFSDLSLFNRCFKQYAGITPGAYRRISHKHHRIY